MTYEGMLSGLKTPEIKLSFETLAQDYAAVKDYYGWDDLQTLKPSNRTETWNTLKLQLTAQQLADVEGKYASDMTVYGK